MKLIYLGWPRSGSTWLHRLLKSNSSLLDLDGQKESHLFYTDPARGLELFKDGMMDFSTNNWSMDSWVAQQLEGCTFVMIHRHPLGIMRSYHIQLENDWGHWQTACMYNNLLLSGDTLERWIDLTKGNILLYEFDDLQQDPLQFGQLVLGDLGIAARNIDSSPASASPQRENKPLNPVLLEIAEKQEKRYQKLAQNTAYRRLR